MPAPDVRSATPAETDRCIAAMVLGFAGDPAARFVFADPQLYLDVFPRFIRAFGGRAFDHGAAHHIDGCAVALWIPPDVQPDEEALMALVESAVADADRESAFGLFEQMGSFHPHEPHWYLPLIGIDPTRQGGGLGSALLGHALAICDQQKMPAYLEATSARSARLYQRHGFAALGSIQAGHSPTLTPMLRRPH
jgi:GNAT superfamily N-acetyltransferase